MFDLNNWKDLPRFIETLNNAIVKQFSSYRDVDELISLSQAHIPYVAQHYDESKNVNFEYYAIFSCKRECLKFIGRQYHECFVNIDFETLNYIDSYGWLVKADRLEQIFWYEVFDRMTVEDFHEDLLRAQLVEQFIASIPEKLQFSRMNIINLYLEGFSVKEVGIICQIVRSYDLLYN